MKPNRRQRNNKSADTPRPPVLGIIFTVLCVLSCFNAICQDSPNVKLRIHLRPVAEYEVALKKYYNQMWTAERTEFVNIQKGRAWDLVPNVGLVFGLPSVNLNTGQIANYYQKKSIAKQKLKSLDMSFQTAYNEETQKLRVEHEKAKMMIENLYLSYRKVTLEQWIYDIHKEAFDKKEMKPEDFYAKKLVWFRSEDELKAREEAIRLLIFDIEKIARYNLPDDPIWYENLGEDDSLMHSPKPK